MKKKLLIYLMLTVVSCHLIGGDITTERPNTDDVFNVLGYTWWKFSVPNEKKLKNLQCALLVYTKDKNGVWSKQEVYSNFLNPAKDAKIPDKFIIGFYQKGNEIVLRLESQTSVIKVENKFGLDKLDQSATNLSLDENGDIVLKWKSNGQAETGKKESMQSYLAMHISIADGLK